ncbi:hypothetical protein [Desulfonatronum parangueonense]
MMKMKNDRFLFGRLFSLQTSLCKIEPQGRETVGQCVESLKSFLKLLQHAKETTPNEFHDGIMGMMGQVFGRIEDLLEKKCNFEEQPQEEESQDQGDDEDYQTEYFVTARETCIHCEGTGTSIKFGITCNCCDGYGHRNEYEIPFEEAINENNLFNKLWDTVETMQEKINELEGHIKRLGG